MKLFRFWLPTVIAAVSLSSAAFASCNCYSSDLSDEIDERDFDAVVEYVNSKRTIELQEKATNLAISGDVRAEWQHITEKVNGVARRGGGARDCDGNLDPVDAVSGTPNGQRITTSDFDIEFNLYFDYKCDRTWAVAQLQFDNSMGVQEFNKEISTQDIIIDADAQNVGSSCQRFDNQGPFGSGRVDGISLRRAYIGYNICTDGCSRFDVEVGRRRFYDSFDSRIEFNAIFDGVLFRYATQMDCAADLYVNLGGFVIDERSNHFGWIIEVGALNVADSGIDVKYSFVDWDKKGTNRAFASHPRGWQHHVHQFLGYYHFSDDLLCMPAKAYGAFLFNSKALRRIETNNTYARYGWYLGAIVGEVCREGDWSLDINYQYVQAQAIPDPDVSGIGRGNVLGESFTMRNGDAANSRGNGNYKGWRVEGLYALTDNLSIDAVFQYSRAADSSIGGNAHYSKWKLQAIYAF